MRISLTAAAMLSISLAMHGLTLAGESVPISGSVSSGSTNAPPCDHYWCTFQGGGYISAAYTKQDGPEGYEDLHGFRLRWGGWDTDPYRRGFAKPFPDAGGFYFWLGETGNVSQNLWTSGLGVDLSFLALGPVRVFFRPELGITYRTHNPYDGWGAVAALGLGTGVLLTHHWQLVLAVDRDFDFTAANSFRSSVEIRWLSSKMPFPLAE